MVSIPTSRPCQMQIIEQAGNLFSVPAVALVNAVNCEGVMGKGLALQFKTRFPDAFQSYRAACLEQTLRPGRLHTFHLPDGRWVINFPTKVLWRLPSRIDYLSAGLPALTAFLRAQSIPSVALPALGCGLGGLAWGDVRPLILSALSSVGDSLTTVWIFPPASSPPPSIHQTPARK